MGILGAKQRNSYEAEPQKWLQAGPSPGAERSPQPPVLVPRDSIIKEYLGFLKGIYKGSIGSFKDL